MTDTDTITGSPSLESLSEAATKGDLNYPEWGMDFRAGNKLVGMMNPSVGGNGKANRDYLCRLWNDHRANRLHTSEALAQAIAAAREEGILAAIAVCTKLTPPDDAYHAGRIWDEHRETVGAIEKDIRALIPAPKPPQPNTQELLEPKISTAWVENTGHVVINGDGKPIAKLTKKKALHLMASIAEALASDEKR